VRSAAWTHAQVICEVARDADFISFGGALYLKGKAWVDDLKLDVIGPSGQGNEAPHPLSERGVENLIAFGRLLGYVRYFHPSDEAAANDWDSFTIAGVDLVEAARNPVELKERLDRLFRPLARTLRLSTLPLPPLAATGLSPVGKRPERITGWRHVGYSGAYSGFYEARRVVAPSNAPGDSLLPIGSEVNTALGGGVWCSVPLTLYQGTGRTLSRSSGGIPISRRPDGWLPTGNDRATRLADVLLLWNVMQHFFPYFDVTGTDWLAQLAPALHKAAIDSDGGAFESTIRRLSASLHDGHVYVGSPYTSPDARSWPFVWAFVQNRLILTQVDSAFAVDTHVGDEVLAIQGRATSQWVEEFRLLESGATNERVRFRIARALMASAARDTIELDLRSPVGVARHVRLGKQRSVTLTPAPPDSVQEIRPGVMYLDLNRITDADFKGALPKINAGRGVIFDLRGYPNRVSASMLAHLTDSTIASPRLGFPIILRPDHRDTSYEWETWPIKPETPRIRVHAAFLINANAISAAETFLGIVEHYRLADLVGEPTAGTNGVVTTVLLPGRYSVPFTGMRVLKEDGSRHHGIGILPTVSVSPTIEGVAAGRDEQLERAIKAVLR